jgi:formylglycine-generating enzyme required for sulfatase activity
VRAAVTRRVVEAGILATTLGCNEPPDVPSDAERTRCLEPDPTPPVECEDVQPRVGTACVRGGCFGEYWDPPAGQARPEHVVATLLFDVTEVTVGAYAACVDAGACTPPDYSDERCMTTWWPSMDWLRAEHPVSCVGAAQAQTYCEWAGGRLPTEWEWEWAARGREEARLYPFEDGLGWGCEKVVCCGYWAMPEELEACRSGCGLRHPDYVGSRSPQGDSRDGLRDMVGNVDEWTSTRVLSEGAIEQVGRGGDFATEDRPLRDLDHDEHTWDPGPTTLSVVARSAGSPDFTSLAAGMRCVYDVTLGRSLPSGLELLGQQEQEQSSAGRG